MMRAIIHALSGLVCTLSLLLWGCSTEPTVHSLSSGWIGTLDTVKAGPFDTGKMWTFDFPPEQYLARTYDLKLTNDWFDRARLAALRLPGCSAAFVSEDGLVMTNHHCARTALVRVRKDGEDLLEDGFYASSLTDERKAPVWADQLVLIEDVTKEVQEAFDAGATDSAKSAQRTEKMNEIQERYGRKFRETTKDSMVFRVMSFYSGGRYSLYGYKRYTDVRLVFAPEEKAAFFGGDPDNFTYPRYDFDCSFFRVYENGKPLKTPNYYRFSPRGAAEGEVVFVIGNPGTTNRLMTLSQLETLRDYQYPSRIDATRSRLRAMSEYLAKHPDKRQEYLNQIFRAANTLKAYSGVLAGLDDPYLMAKKRDFELRFKEAVLGNPVLMDRYGNPWDEIADHESQRRAIMGELTALNPAGTRSQYLTIAGRLVARAEGGAEQEEGRQRPDGAPPEENIQRGTGRAIFPRTFEPEIEVPLLADQLRFMKRELGDRNEAFNELLAGRSPEQAAEEISKMTLLGTRAKVDSLAKGNPEGVLTSDDPLLMFVVRTRERLTQLQEEQKVIREKEEVPSQMLGRALFEVYGTSIPPDATFSLRIADGVVKGYEYNGTLAPPVTTFYGLYDRYYSFGKQNPWLPGDKWLPPPAGLTMSVPLDFVSTNDAVGGNSGSSVVNSSLEVVGLLFDGNIESLPGNFIYDEMKNRSVSVHSAGLLEGIEQVYKAMRLGKELRKGKIVR